jgi:hypothetical protein
LTIHSDHQADVIGYEAYLDKVHKKRRKTPSTKHSYALTLIFFFTHKKKKKKKKKEKKSTMETKSNILHFSLFSVRQRFLAAVGGGEVVRELQGVGARVSLLFHLEPFFPQTQTSYQLSLSLSFNSLIVLNVVPILSPFCLKLPLRRRLSLWFPRPIFTRSAPRVSTTRRRLPPPPHPIRLPTALLPATVSLPARRISTPISSPPQRRRTV